MDFNEIISNSFKYPFTDFKNLAVIFALFFLASIFYIGVMLDDRNVFIVGIITFIIVCLIAPGYLICYPHDPHDLMDRLVSSTPFNRKGNKLRGFNAEILKLYCAYESPGDLVKGGTCDSAFLTSSQVTSFHS